MTTSNSQPYLSIAAKLALKPWFSEEALAEGLSLLAGGESEFLFYREAAGAFFGEGKGITASLLFEVTDRISQGFRIAGCRCSVCRKNPLQKGSNCGHLAGLAIAMLDRFPAEGEQPRPLPLVFEESPWQRLGFFLFDLYQRRGSFHLLPEAGKWKLEFREREKLLLNCLLPGPVSSQLLELFPRLADGENWKATAPLGKLAVLFGILQETTLTRIEVGLRSVGRESRGIERDRSLWLWLARFFARELGPAGPRLRRGEDGEFFLLGGNLSGATPRFTLYLERQHATGLLKVMNSHLPEVVFLPPARRFFRVEIASDSSLLVTPCLRLGDGRTFTGSELAGLRYRDHYYLAGEGFLPVAPPAGEDDLRPAAPAPASLFDAVRDKPDPDLPFSIPNREIPGFVETNRKALTGHANEVDPELLTAPCRELPDGLELLADQEDDHWYYLSGHYRIGSRRVALPDLLAARLNGLSYLPDSGLQLTGTGLDWFHGLGPDRFWQKDGEIQGVRLNRRELLRLTGVIGAVELPEGAAGDRLRRLLHTDSWGEPASLPGCPDHLRDYQRHGLAWLFHLHAYGLGGILADDMGLGKTHQALGLFWTLRRSGPGRRFLVVCPATVASHWTMKLERFYPELSWSLYHGPDRELSRMEGAEVVVTTYGVLRQDAELLAEIPFEIIVFDEMQQLKNKKTAIYQAAVRLGGRIIIGLTGTPLENSVRDLKALFDLCLPGALGSDEGFARNYATPITEHASREKKDELARLLKPFFLRRDRQQVLKELPEVIEDIRTCELSPDQVTLYREAIAGGRQDLLESLAGGSSLDIPYMELLALVATLKQICNHPALLAGPGDEETEYASGKWDLFVELLAECLESGMKVVVFSQYTRMLDLIERHLAAGNIGFRGLRGNMTLKARTEAIGCFNEERDCRVFCASLLAGGTGIDLTAAQAVIHYDRWWNAAKEDQATARVHRMGQQRVVQVFKLVTVGTLEEKIHRLIESRRDLASRLIQADDTGMVRQLSRADLLELLR